MARGVIARSPSPPTTLHFMHPEFLRCTSSLRCRRAAEQSLRHHRSRRRCGLDPHQALISPTAIHPSQNTYLSVPCTYRTPESLKLFRHLHFTMVWTSLGPLTTEPRKLAWRPKQNRLHSRTLDNDTDNSCNSSMSTLRGVFAALSGTDSRTLARPQPQTSLYSSFPIPFGRKSGQAQTRASPRLGSTLSLPTPVEVPSAQTRLRVKGPPSTQSM
ncbi:hypothetical protein B0H15DRAFT_872170 [Mycena belliarum]|uniref:Uncharacterized protein n=1 Tax=Mycena belliarum TaxID=1033014 RepID=A0AAD6TNA6_9AGAR|nr:hypothetical protein B0H15DRAFT_872170 [Mycena belliae]